ncbi:hypothetical protein [Leptolyngbya sp. FACHB-17]|uniref:hypothetical protein n=1 Tax=unclassified Leptolyngbya TaxID=2650499 RepID=UPI0016800B81|nr:hypothetical protein [Leptolyngbya sp. FACHB-17]MBD2079692.1 hypothetical protein [Leptolyngbya sp. FACHB-17]
MLTKEAIAQVLKINPENIEKFGINQKCVQVWLKDSPEVLSVSFEKLGLDQKKLISTEPFVVIAVVLLLGLVWNAIANYKPASYDAAAEAEKCVKANMSGGERVTHEDMAHIERNCGRFLR